MNYNPESTPVLNYIQLLKGFTFLVAATYQFFPKKQAEKYLNEN